MGGRTIHATAESTLDVAEAGLARWQDRSVTYGLILVLADGAWAGTAREMGASREG